MSRQWLRQNMPNWLRAEERRRAVHAYCQMHHRPRQGVRLNRSDLDSVVAHNHPNPLIGVIVKHYSDDPFDRVYTYVEGHGLAHGRLYLLDRIDEIRWGAVRRATAYFKYRKVRTRLAGVNEQRRTSSG